MKKITLASLALLTYCLSYGQQTISFEESEGFALGDINGQNTWFVTGCGTGCFVENQVISDEQASDGSFSLKISPDLTFGTDNGIIFGGFLDFSTPLDHTDLVISYDIYITEQGESDFRFGVAGEDGGGGLFFVYLVDFDFEGNIKVVNAAGTDFEVVGTWNINTWYNVRAETTGTSISYFIDDTQVATSNLLNAFDITQIRFVHDNFAGDGYIDNIRINDEALSIDTVFEESFSYYYDENEKHLVLNSSNKPINEVELYNLLGQRVLTKTNSSEAIETIDLSLMDNGIYLATVSIDGQSTSFKFIKH